MIQEVYVAARGVLAGKGDETRCTALERVSERLRPLYSAGQLDSTRPCARFGTATDGCGVPSLPSLESFFCEHFYPFDWVSFLCTRIRNTLPQLKLSEEAVATSLSFSAVTLGRQRQVLTSAWLRFVLHSIPTRRRLHDQGIYHFPWCLHHDADIRHVSSCVELEFVLSFMD